MSRKGGAERWPVTTTSSDTSESASASEAEPESEPKLGSTSDTSSSSSLLCRKITPRDDGAGAGEPRSGRGMSGERKLSLTCVVAAAFSRTNRFASQNVTGCSVDADEGPTEMRAAARVRTSMALV